VHGGDGMATALHPGCGPRLCRFTAGQRCSFVSPSYVRHEHEVVEALVCRLFRDGGAQFCSGLVDSVVSPPIEVPVYLRHAVVASATLGEVIERRAVVSGTIPHCEGPPGTNA
jgi:hypothetical protein